MIQVVKIGGNVIDDAAALTRFLEKFAAKYRKLFDE